MLQRLLALIRKEFIQIRRDKRTLAMMIVLPVLWLVMFGYAFSFDVKSATVAIVDESNSPAGAKIAETLRSYDRFVVKDLGAASEAGIRAAIHRDEVQLGVLIPADLTKGGQVRVLVDGTNLFTAQASTRLLQGALEPLQKGAAVGGPAAGGAAPAAPTAMTPKLEILYNPELASAPVMIPGLLGLVTMFMAVMMTALGMAPWSSSSSPRFARWS
jgi:ABC-2 type transport system permease protein